MMTANHAVAYLAKQEVVSVEMADDGARGRIKGAAFREFACWYAERLGQERIEDALRSLRHPQQDRLDPADESLGILASVWYPAELVHELLEALIRDVPRSERSALAQEAADIVMSRTLRGLYRVLFQWMATPERYARYCGRLWASYYDSGDFRVQMPDPCTAICTITDWQAHHPFICDLNHGAAGAIYRHMGCEDVNVDRVACVAQGAPHCCFATTWTS